MSADTETPVITVVRVPEVAAGTTEVVLSEWLVETGELVAAGREIAVVETDKAIVEIETDASGHVARLLPSPGDQIEVGTPLAVLAGPDTSAQDIEVALAEVGVPAPEDAEVNATQSASGNASSVANALRSGGEETKPPQRIFMSPLVRRLLREAGLTADEVVGSGPHGRIMRRDIEALLKAHREPVPERVALEHSSPAAHREPESVPHNRLRQAVARRLTESKRSVPHFYLERSVDVSSLLKMRREINETGRASVSINDFVVRAAAVALSDVPEANVIWTDDALLQFREAEVAVAIASERGLVTPVLRTPQLASLGLLSSAMRDLVARANAGRLKQADLEGGSLTVSNLGMYGVESFSAIINPPHSMILAVGAVRPGVVAIDDECHVRPLMQLTVSIDHRAIDGAVGAQWLDALVNHLRCPMGLII